MIEEAKLTKQQKRDKRRALLSSLEQQKHQAGDKKNEKLKYNKITNHQQQSGSSVYRRKACYPQTSITSSNTPNDRFICPKDKDYMKILKASYEGFEIDKREVFDDKFHINFCNALEDLDNQGIYQFDIIQPLGLNTKLSKTYVSRCLVGMAGITYKYQGLRMFAIPWTKEEIGSNDSTVSIGNLNNELIKRTEFLLKKSRAGKECGSCNYNLTLINRCYPDNTSNKYPKMKFEPTFNEEKVTVSWHADSTLEHFSSIAVYQHTKDDDKTEDVDRWKLALRTCLHAEGPLQGKECSLQVNAPPLAIPLPNNTCYYLLDEFNHHHQHSVLAGKSQRYASTHRVARVDGHTYGSIRTKCIAAINGSGYSGKQIRSEQLAICELEFEWIRQFFIQGEKHKNKNLYWSDAFVKLLDIWRQLEMKTLKTIEVLEDAVLLSQSIVPNSKKELKKLNKRKKRISSIDQISFTEMIKGLQNRYDKRKGWIQRANDPIFKSEPIDCRPIEIPFDLSPHPDSSAAQMNLRENINKLGLLKAQYDLSLAEFETNKDNYSIERKRATTESNLQKSKKSKIEM